MSECSNCGEESSALMGAGTDGMVCPMCYGRITDYKRMPVYTAKEYDDLQAEVERLHKFLTWDDCQANSKDPWRVRVQRFEKAKAEGANQ